MKKTVCIAGMLLFTSVTIAQAPVIESAPASPRGTAQQQRQSSNSDTNQEFMMPVASPKVTTKQQFSTSIIELEYSRPSIKERRVFGEMIPFGRPWRTGANAITKITFGEEIYFGGQRVRPGTYALYTIPDQDRWAVVLNTNHRSSGLNDIKPEDDIARVMVRPSALREPVETFTIELNDITSTSATLNIIWEHTKVSVPIKADNQERILAYLDKELKGKNPPYRNASYYYAEIGKNLDKAIEYADKVLAENPNAFWIHSHKANVYKQMGKKKEALKAAEKAAEMAKGTGYEEEYAKKVAEYR